MKKLLSKVLSILTATILLVSALPVAALAEQQGYQLGDGITLTHKVTVMFVDPLASGDPETKEFNSGESLPLSDFPALSHDGYRQTGWTDASGNVVSTTVENL